MSTIYATNVDAAIRDAERAVDLSERMFLTFQSDALRQHRDDCAHSLRSLKALRQEMDEMHRGAREVASHWSNA